MEPFGLGMLNATFIALALIMYALRHQSRRKFEARARGLPLPPRPKSRFLVGNLFDIVAKKPWHTFTEMRSRYGDIIYLEALGNRIIVLNSLKAVHDLLEMRARIYSDRPTFTMIGELIGLNKSLPMLPYGPEFRKQRKLCHHGLNPAAVKKYHTVQITAVSSYVAGILANPETFISELRLTAGRIVLSVTYGFPVDMDDTSYLEEAEATMAMIEKGTMMGAYYVDIFPALKHLPNWLPFNPISKVASSGRSLLHSMINRPYQHVKRALEDGTASASFVADCLTQAESGPTKLSEDNEDSIRWAAGSMYGAGGESSFATVLTFIYAMALYPEVQKKVQDEIDRVIGHERLPTLDDKDQLPYVRCAIKETLRWRPALPMAIPRMTTQDDHYNGYFIPAGTIILPNVWAISIDDVSGMPSAEFMPERFMNTSDTPDKAEDVIDPSSYSFGFGRRLCPGKVLGENNIFLFVTYLMATLHISRKKDTDGICVPLQPDYTAGLVSFPTAFSVNFMPRNKERVSLLSRN
ncbi:cytochrome P450 [Agrocybe pediades]|nr:cytochrome P450 [Agrocybe pediades]